MASTSAAGDTYSSSTSRCAYQVFLSFRGEDTRKTFTDHLYTALVNAGFHTFRDDDELERGEDIRFELAKAIQQSQISIIVFSKDYASSRWCLDELVNILERKKSVDHMVLPVFYHIDPSHVRNQTGSFAESFARHGERFAVDKVEGWKSALRQVADLAGMPLKNQHEAQFIQKIVKEIGRKLNRRVLSVALQPIGTDPRVKDVNLLSLKGSKHLRKLPKIISKLELPEELVQLGMVSLITYANVTDIINSLSYDSLRWLLFWRSWYLQSRRRHPNFWSSISSTSSKMPLKGLYELGIFSAFIPGSEVPDWFTYKSTWYEISFRVPSLPDHKIRSLNICVVYPLFKDSILSIEIHEVTKGRRWRYIPTFYCLPKDDKKMTWLSHWKVFDQLEAGDEVIVSSSTQTGDHFKILGKPKYVFGVHLVYHKKQERGAQSNGEEETVNRLFCAKM